MAGPTASRRYKGRSASQRAEQVALWVLDLWTDARRTGYIETRNAIMDKFECGQQLAEQAIKVARAVLAERANDPALRDKIVDAHWDLFDDSKANKDRREARRNLESLTRIMGLAAPSQLKVTGAVTLDLEALSDEELEAAAGVARDIAKRSAERAKPASGTSKTDGGN